MPFRYLRELLTVLTWSEKPTTMTAPMRGKRYRRGKHVKRIWVDRKLVKRQSGDVYVGLGIVDTSLIKDKNDPSAWLGWPGQYRVSTADASAFLQWALNMPSADELAEARADGAIYRLDCAITEMLPGYYLLRWFRHPAPLTLFGIGHAWVQIEAILTDVRYERPVVQIVHRKRKSGIPKEFFLVPWIRGDSRTLVKELIYTMATDILAEIHLRLGQKK